MTPYDPGSRAWKPSANLASLVIISGGGAGEHAANRQVCPAVGTAVGTRASQTDPPEAGSKSQRDGSPWRYLFVGISIGPKQR